MRRLRLNIKLKVWISIVAVASIVLLFGNAKAEEKTIDPEVQKWMEKDPLYKEWLEMLDYYPKPDREWEKKWVGKTIDASNVDQVKDLLPEITYLVTKNWGATMKVVPAQTYWRPSEGFIKATKQYMDQVTIDEKGVMHGFIGGCCFPRPGKNPSKIAWNRDRGTYEGDDFLYMGINQRITDAKGRTRNSGVNYCRMRYAYRTDVEPIPEIPGNTANVYRATRNTIYMPFDIKGVTVLVIKYKEPEKDDDMWTFVPTMRRVRRMSSGQRCDNIAGTDVCNDDADIYDGEVLDNDYKWIGLRDCLLSYHLKYPYPPEIKYENRWGHNWPVQKRPTYVFEANSNLPNFCYTKRIWYIEPVSFRIYCATLYDRKGRLWKEQNASCDANMIDPNNPYNNPSLMQYMDWQTRHATTWLFEDAEEGMNWGINKNTGVKHDFFSVVGIKKYGH